MSKLDIVMAAIFFVYITLGYWATGLTIYSNKIIFHAFGQLFMRRLIIGTLLGWVLIPIAIIRTVLIK